MSPLLFIVTKYRLNLSDTSHDSDTTTLRLTIQPQVEFFLHINFPVIVCSLFPDIFRRGVNFMLDSKKIAAFIADKRKQKGLTQQQVADALHVSFQAVSKWESGASYPTIELLYALSNLYQQSDNPEHL